MKSLGKASGSGLCRRTQVKNGHLQSYSNNWNTVLSPYSAVRKSYYMELRPQSELQHGVVGQSLKTSQNVNELSLTDGFWTLSVSGGIVRSSLRATGDTGKAREWNKTSASCRQYFQRHKGIRGLHNQKFTMSECMLLKRRFLFLKMFLLNQNGPSYLSKTEQTYNR